MFDDLLSQRFYITVCGLTLGLSIFSGLEEYTLLDTLVASAFGSALQSEKRRLLLPLRVVSLKFALNEVTAQS